MRLRSYSEGIFTINDRERISLISRARRVNSLSSNDLHELRRIYSSSLKPFSSDLNSIMDRAHADDDAVLLKAAIKGMGSLSGNERFRLEQATTRKGRRIPG